MDGDDRRPPPEEDFTDGADVVPFPGGGHPSLGESDRRGGDDHRAPGAGRTEAWDRSEPAGSEEDPPAGTSPGPFDFDPVQPDADPTRDEPEGADDSLDELTHEHYVAATTEEYKGLARSVAEAAKQQHEQQAVAASMPGVGTGLVGFEDVIGRPVAEEEQRGPSDLPVRVLTAVVLVALLVTALWAGGWWFVGLLVVLGSVAVGEFYAVLRRRGFVPMSLLGLLGLAGIMVAGRIGGPAAIGGAVAGLALVLLLFYSVVPRRDPLENAALTLLGAVWVGLLAFAIPIERSDRAVALILAIVVVTAVFDSASFFTGRSIGRTSLAPRLSPKKTLEGVLGGIVAAAVIGGVLGTVPWFDPLDTVSGLVLGGVAALFGLLGDLGESMIKRLLQVKDMGGVLPGHGGILDRLDSLLFVVPAAFYLFTWLGYL